MIKNISSCQKYSECPLVSSDALYMSRAFIVKGMDAGTKAVVVNVAVVFF